MKDQWDRRDVFGGAGLVALAALGSSSAFAQSPSGDAGTSGGEAALAAGMAHLSGVIRDFPAAFAGLGAPATQLDMAEGYRLFLRYLTIGIDESVQYGDPAFPAFYQNTRDGVRKFAGDSPEQLYDGVSVSADYDYVITGNLRETALIEFTLYSGGLHAGSGKRRLIASLTDEALQRDADGNFTVHLNRSGKGANAIRLEPDASKLLVRRYVRDPRKDRPRPLLIERVGNGPEFLPLAAEPLGKAIAGTADFAMWNVKTWAKWAARDRTIRINALGTFGDTGDIFTPAGHRYLSGYWQVPDDKALLIEFQPPKEAYWSFVPMNFWMESFEWRFGNQVYASSFATPVAQDGYARFALASRDPGIRDVQWIETMGHTEGPMSLRMARHTGPLPDVRCRLVPLAAGRGRGV